MTADGFLQELSFTGGTLNPSFNKNTYEYNVFLSGLNFSFTADPGTDPAGPRLDIMQIICNGETIFEGYNAYTVSNAIEETTIYYIKTLYARYKLIISPNVGMWPIQQTQLTPDFYGGSYVPNYRTIKRIYTIGSGSNDYENTYNSLVDLNEDAINFMNDFIAKATEKGQLDAIVETFIHYSGFVNYNWVDDGDYRFYLPIIQVSSSLSKSLMGGYTPKNNKLYSYPFNSLEIIGYGQNSELKFENFINPQKPLFGIVSKFYAGASIQLYPLDYDGLADNFDAGCTGDSLPILPYTKDNFKNEYNAGQNSRLQAQNAMRQDRNFNRITTGVQMLGNGITGMSSAIMGNASNDTINTLTQGISLYAKGELKYNQGMAAMEATLKDVVNRPSTIANQNATPSIPALVKDGICPYVVKKSVRKEFLEKIDNFFSRYGYKVSQIKTPNIKSRKAFNFLKCNDAHVGGNIPNGDLLEIKAILEHGITFWHTDNVGDYTQDNSIL